MSHADRCNAESAIRGLLIAIGEDPNRPGLAETPGRVARAWLEEWASGYGQDPADVMKVFKDGAEGCDEMVMVRDIPFESHCEHHMARISGMAHIGYIPNGKILGLSKLVRVTNIYARRLQVQERATNQIAEALWTHLRPLGVGVVIRASHGCMEARGVRVHGSTTVTSALRGAFKDEPEVRAEFLSLVNG
jgi:GTP cyclohydrolase I